MSEIASAFVSLLPAARGFGAKLDSQIAPELDKSGKSAGKRFGSGMLGGFGGVATALGGALAATGAISFVRDSVQGFQDHLKVAALTAQAIKSTGGAAKVTAAQVGSLSDALEAQTGVDGDLIQNGANLLLTFTNVRNEVGKGNDIFNQATKTITDMSVALGQDTKGSAIQLGKALNDPIKGVTALSKVGVSFTQQQKDQISTLVKSGKTLDAQKVILAELNKEFGGAAEAAANPVDRMAAVFRGLQDQIGAAFLPLLNKTADFLGQTFIPAVQDFIQQFQDGKTFLNPFVDGLGRVKDAAVGLFDLFVRGDYTGTLRRALGLSEDDAIVGTLFQIRDVILNVVTAVRGNLAPALTAIGTILAGAFVPTLIGAFTTLAGVLSGPVIAIAAIGAGLVLLYQNSQTFRDGIATVLAAVQGAFNAVIPVAQSFIGVIQRNMPTISAIFSQVGQVIGAVLGLLGAQINTFVSVASALWKEYGATIIAVAKPVFAALLGIISGALTVITGIVKAFTALFKGDWAGLWSAIQQIVSGAVKIVSSTIRGGLDAAVALFVGLGPKILGAVSGLGNVLYSAGQNIVAGLIDGISSQAGRLVSFIKQFVADHIPGPVAEIMGIASPSKVMAEQGKWIAAGLAQGMDRNSGLVSRASGGLANAVAGLSPTLAGPRVAYAAQGPYGGLEGLAIAGTLDLGGGLTGYIDGRIVANSANQARQLVRGRR